ncbi:YheC/YheD family endospore coat-associated protein [Bacillus sp. B-jedd]|uniref:YheC/YheD family endospore coat-associated protein n=1 Tax=Bacillus sp. B-jedd TaxID=1476857 RepID=UPI0005155612|nr:YheC/YheD family protein [Bacillus sp. B-jedd]CEG28903.1 glutathione synthetase ATP-binding domain-like protein [Bacillus sp. B-jedd]
MWIEIKAFPNQEPAVLLPPVLQPQADGSRVRIEFGGRTMGVSYAAGQPGAGAGTDFKYPAPLYCSPSLMEGLLLPEGMVFKLRPAGADQYRLGPVIGMLLGEQHYLYNDQLMAECTDAMGAYPEIGGLIYGFKCSSIDWEKEQIYGLAFNFLQNKWEYGMFPFPEVIYRRSFLNGDEETNRFIEQHGTVVFNPKKIDKYEMYLLLQKDPELAEYLPETALLTMESLLSFLQKHRKVILKPAGLSRGRGIIVIEEVNRGVCRIALNQDRKGRLPLTMEIPIYLLKEFLEKDYIFAKKYIVQQYLEMKKINGSSWDIRVVMQKGADRKWHCHGMEVRLAAPEHIVTNISTGGRALRINTALKLAHGNKYSIKKFKMEIMNFCKKFCRTMDEREQGFAEFGLDLCLDATGKLWFIEANTRPSFNGFKALSQKNYLKICESPFRYAAALKKFERKK